MKRLDFVVDNCLVSALIPQLPLKPGYQMFFTTYVELDTDEEGRDSGGVSFDC
jgi:hypothetical protein